MWPNYPYLDTNLGIVTDRLGDPEAAERHFKRAIQLRWDFAGGHYFYGKWLVEQGRAEEAIGRIQDSLQVSPNYSAARTMLMNLYAARGADADLTTLVQETLAISSQDPLALSYANGEFPNSVYPPSLQVVLNMRKTLQQEPESENVLEELGKALAQLGFKKGPQQPPMAQAHEELDAKTKEPTKEQALVTPTPFEKPRGGQLFDQALSIQQDGNRQGAIVLYEELLRLEPEHGEASLNLVELLLEGATKGEWIRGALLAQKVLNNLDPDNLDALRYLASAYRKLGFPEEAKKWDRQYQEKRTLLEKQSTAEPQVAKVGR